MSMKYLLTNDWKFQQLIEYAVCFKFVKMREHLSMNIHSFLQRIYWQHDNM